MKSELFLCGLITLTFALSGCMQNNATKQNYVLEMKLANIAAKTHHPRIALRNYKQAVIDAPDNLLAKKRLAETYLSLAQYEQAMPLLRQLVETSQYKDFARYAMGKVFYQKGLNDKAKAALIKVSNQSKYYGPALNNLAVIYQSEKNFTASQRYFYLALSKYPNDESIAKNALTAIITNPPTAYSSKIKAILKQSTNLDIMSKLNQMT